MTADLIFRPPVLTDLDQMLIYINMLSRERTYITFQGEVVTRQQEEAFLRRALGKKANRSATMMGIFKGSELVGLASIEMGVRTNRHVGHLGVSIAQEYRGQGLGTQLLEKIMATAKQELPELAIVVLGVFANNQVAISMYEKCGFAEYGRLPGGIITESGEIDHIFMYKRV